MDFGKVSVIYQDSSNALAQNESDSNRHYAHFEVSYMSIKQSRTNTHYFLKIYEKICYLYKLLAHNSDLFGNYVVKTVDITLTESIY